ncbi:MAG: alpha/beta hydrolase [Chloroflexi bacterium]|nr:alpha/beta hydrolase [Chloroflexota bacterium]
MPTDTFLTLDNLRLHLNDWGGSGQPILLAHGLASNAKFWNRVAPLLAESFRVAALDQRSHGLSDEARDGDYGFAAVCADVRGVCDGLHFAKPIIVGHSWGAAVALEVAARYPEAVGGVAMIDGGFAGMNRRLTWAEAEQRLAPPRLAGTPLAEFRERVRRGLDGDFSHEIFDIILGNFEVRADGTIAPHLALENHMKIMRAMWEQNPERLYPLAQCPALFLPCIPAEPHDEMDAQYLSFKREGAALAQALMPNARIEWLADSIHDVPLQRPGLVAEKIAAFAESL